MHKSAVSVLSLRDFQRRNVYERDGEFFDFSDAELSRPISSEFAMFSCNSAQCLAAMLRSSSMTFEHTSLTRLESFFINSISMPIVELRSTQMVLNCAVVLLN